MVVKLIANMFLPGAYCVIFPWTVQLDQLPLILVLPETLPASSTFMSIGELQ